MHKDLPDWLFKPLTLIELYTLIILAESPNYAYNIADSITQKLNKDLHHSRQGIAQALRRMEHTGWITLYPHMNRTGRRERPYSITPYGIAQLESELNRLELIIDQGKVALIRHTIRSSHLNPTP